MFRGGSCYHVFELKMCRSVSSAARLMELSSRLILFESARNHSTTTTSGGASSVESG